jgi:hypothetical protein
MEIFLMAAASTLPPSGGGVSTAVYILVPTVATILIAVIGVLWRTGLQAGRDQERFIDTERRITRLENKVFRNGNAANGG